MDRHLRSRMLLALILGVVSASGFQPLNLWPLALVALAGMILLVNRAQSQRSVFVVGWCFGFGHFASSLNWIATAFTYQAAMPAWLGWIAVGLLSVYMALFPAAAFYLASYAGRKNIFRFGLLLASTWMLAEWVRSWLFTGFAWNPLGVMLMPLPQLAQAAAVIGGLGLSAIVIVMALVIALVATGRWRVAVAPAILIGAIATGGYWYMQQPIAADGARVRIVQPNIGQEEKWAEETAAAIADRFAALSGLPDGGKRLLLWPEASVRDYLEEEPEARLRLARLLGPDDLLLAGGIGLVRDDAGEISGARNALFVMDSAGRLRGRYDKAHLVPYGEYLPMRPLLSLLGLSRLAPGDLDFIPGNGPQTMGLPGFGAAGIQICYEIIFAGHVVDAANRPDFLFNPSNDAWFGSWGPPQHLAQARLRAIEEGLPVARSTPTGISAVIDPMGRVTASLPYKKPGVIDVNMPAALPTTVFAQIGAWAAAILGCVLMLLALSVHRQAGGRS